MSILIYGDVNNFPMSEKGVTIERMFLDVVYVEITSYYRFK